MSGKVAVAAEERKSGKYQGLSPGYIFVPIAIETLEAIVPRSLAFLEHLGPRIKVETGELKSTEYLLQRLSVAVQHGNCVAVLGSTCY